MFHFFQKLYDCLVQALEKIIQWFNKPESSSNTERYQDSYSFSSPTQTPRGNRTSYLTLFSDEDSSNIYLRQINHSDDSNNRTRFFS